jgi:hypothetical protein
MVMRGRDFLDTAAHLSQMRAESDWRSAISRVYYALYLDCRDALRRWGFPIPQRSSHRDVSQRLALPKNPDLFVIAGTFGRLSSLRNRADYDLALDPMFQTSTAARNAVSEARNQIALLDAIDSDPARRSQAIADIRVVFP